jgi:hypothetical protein
VLTPKGRIYFKFEVNVEVIELYQLSEVSVKTCMFYVDKKFNLEHNRKFRLEANNRH